MAIQWSLVLFTALTGLAGWMFAAIAVSEFKGTMKDAAFPAGLVALIVLIVGGCCSVTHLSHPDRMLGALGHPTSGIFTEAVLVGLVAICAIVYLILLKRDASAGARKACVALAAVFGIALSFLAGSSYMMSSRPSWNTFALPLGYMGTVIPAGIAAYLAVAGAKKVEVDGIFPTLLMVGGIIAALTAAIYAAVSGTMADSVLYIWVMAVAIGGLLPAVLGYLAKKKPASMLTYASVALICAVVGSVAFRCFMWVSTTSIDNFFHTI